MSEEVARLIIKWMMLKYEWSLTMMLTTVQITCEAGYHNMIEAR